MSHNSNPENRSYRICGTKGWVSKKGEITPDVTQALSFKSRVEAVKQIELLKVLFEDLVDQPLYVATFLKSDLENEDNTNVSA